MEIEELGKDMATTCEYQSGCGKGCKIRNRRPIACREFHCSNIYQITRENLARTARDLEMVSKELGDRIVEKYSPFS